MKKQLQLFMAFIFIATCSLHAQIGVFTPLSTGGTNFVMIQAPDNCTGFPVEICGNYSLAGGTASVFSALDVPGLDFEIVGIDQLNQTFCVNILEGNFANSSCVDVIVDITYANNGTTNAISSNTINVCAATIDCACIAATISNIQCYNNGTVQEEDDYWSFDIEVINPSGNGTTWTTEPFYAEGQYGTKKTILPGFITDFPDLKFFVQDTADADCIISVEVVAPAACSAGCDLFGTVKTGACNDNGTDDYISDDNYAAQITIISDSPLSEWELSKRYLADNSVEVLSTGYGAQILDYVFPVIEGDWIMSVEYINDPDCVTTEFVDAPAACSGCFDVTVSNTICNDNGTPEIEEDDFWTFDLLVQGGLTSMFNLPEFDTSGFYGQTLTLTLTDFVNCAELIVQDSEKSDDCPDASLLVCPPTPCSFNNNGCPMIIDIGKAECVKVDDGNGGFDAQFLQYIDISNTPDKCWKITKIDILGNEEIVYEGIGNENIVIGPFPELINFQLRFEFCNSEECLLTFDIIAPECDKLKDDKDIQSRRRKAMISPNPLMGSQLNFTFPQDASRYVIYDVNGRVVAAESVSSPFMTVDLNVAPGLYLVHIHRTNGELIQRKIVKN